MRVEKIKNKFDNRLLITMFIILSLVVSFTMPVMGSDSTSLRVLKGRSNPGGYDLVNIVFSTIDILEEKRVITGQMRKEYLILAGRETFDSLSSSPSIINIYSRIGSVLLEKKIVSQAEIDAAMATAARSGGLKVGGINPVVLAASYLDLLVQKGIVTLPAAQSILDSSRK